MRDSYSLKSKATLVCNRASWYSLIDDRDFLQTIMADKDCALSLMLLHAYPLLRYIALKVGQ